MGSSRKRNTEQPEPYSPGKLAEPDMTTNCSESGVEIGLGTALVGTSCGSLLYITFASPGFPPAPGSCRPGRKISLRDPFDNNAALFARYLNRPK